MTINSDRRQDTAADLPDPRPRLTLRQRLVYLGRVRRIEFLPVEASIFIIPALLTLPSPADLLSPTFVIAFLTALCGIHFIDLTNVVADREVDKIYKSRLSDAVYGLGVRNVQWQGRITAAVAFGMGVYLAVTTGHWDIVLLVAATLYLGAQYSIKPLWIKGSGVWQIPGLMAICYVLPMLMVTRAVSGEVDLALLAAIFGFGAYQVGVIMVNTAEDWPEDEVFGIHTSVRALGLSRAMAVATTLVAVGGVATCAAVYAIGGFTIGFVPLAVAVVLTAIHLFGTWRGVAGRSIEDALANLRPRAKLVPLQIGAGGWCTVVAAAFVLATR
jgi:lycopene elongase/hydratase (dihydrobisanhydrobacterioruberin-forming)